MQFRRIRLGKLRNGSIVDFAVEELVRYLRSMDPELIFDILSMDSVEESFRDTVWVGTDPKLTAYLPQVEDPVLDDAIAIRAENGQGYITGTNQRSVLIAVYRFLRELGCQWLRPGVEGERIPKKPLEQISVSVREAAAHRHRAICIEGSNTYDTLTDTIDFLPKIGMNAYFIQFDVPLYFFQWRGYDGSPYPDKQDLSIEKVRAMGRSLEEELARRGLLYHKVGHGWTGGAYGVNCYEWQPRGDYPIPEQMRPHLAEIQGQRDWFSREPLNTNLCYSNPDARKKMVDAAVQYAKNNRHVDYLHFWLADGAANQCECAACREKRPADWYMILLNELDEQLTKAGLDTKIAFACTYLDLLWEPLEETLHNPARFVLMFCPARRNDWGTPYSENPEYPGQLPEYARNKPLGAVPLPRSVAHLKQWQKTTPGDSFCYCYNMYSAGIYEPGYERCTRDLLADAKDLKLLKLNGMMYPQSNRCFFPTALPTYAAGLALWSGDYTFEDKARQYYQAAFGADWECVHQYLSAISELFRIYTGGSERCQNCRQVIAEAEKIQPVIARNLHGENAYDWMVLSYHTQYVTLLAELIEQAATGGNARNAYDKLFAWLSESEVALRKVLDCPEAKKKWSYLVP